MTNAILMTLKKVCHDFGIGSFQEIKTRLGGLANLILKIQTSKGFYVVRFLKKEIGIDRIVYAYSMISMLYEGGVPVLKPLLNNNGSSYAQYHNNIIQVIPFIEASSFQWKPTQAYYSGQILRKFHQTLITVDKSPRVTGVYRYYDLDPITIMKGLKDEGHSLPKQNISVLNGIYTLINQYSFDMSGLPKTVIHGDWNHWNQLYKENGEVECVLDFDSLQKGERIFDVAYALYFFLIQNQNESIAREFLRGYGRLTEQEINLLPILIAKIGFFFGIFVDHGEFELVRNSPQLEWCLSGQGMRTIEALCVREGKI